MRTPARILIADDNPENLDIFRTRLAVHGYETLTATDGEEALRQALGLSQNLLTTSWPRRIMASPGGAAYAEAREGGVLGGV